MFCLQVISYRSCDNTRENCFFQIWSYSRAYVRIISENTKKSTTCNNSIKAESKTTKQKLIGLLPLRRGDPFNYNYFWIPKYAERYVSLVAGKYHDVIAGKRHFFNLTSPRPRKNHSGGTNGATQSFQARSSECWFLIGHKKMLCIVPHRRTAYFEFFSCVRTRRLLSHHICPKHLTNERNPIASTYIHTTFIELL